MTTYTSSNGLSMVEGRLFNWQALHTYRDQTGPIFYHVSYGGISGIEHSANYHPDTDMLSINGTAFKVPNMQIAEILVASSLLGGGDIDFPPLYKKVDKQLKLEYLRFNIPMEGDVSPNITEGSTY